MQIPILTCNKLCHLLISWLIIIWIVLLNHIWMGDICMTWMIYSTLVSIDNRGTCGNKGGVDVSENGIIYITFDR